MPVCGYVVLPVPGATARLAARLAAIPGCEPTPAEQGDLLILVTDTADAAEEARLQEALQQVAEIECMVLAFGEITENSDVTA